MQSGFKDKRPQFWEALLDWAALMVENKVAHVVFVCDGAFADDATNISSIGFKYDVINIDDATPSESLEYVSRNLPPALATPESAATVGEALKLIGGRLSDLNALIWRIEAGTAPEVAVEEMVQKAIKRLRLHGLGESQQSSKGMAWTKPQFWWVMERLTEAHEVPYDELLFAPLFRGDHTPIQAMARADLITVVQSQDRPKMVRVARPLYVAAFTRMKEDKRLSG
eukprot:TRINITY_DN7236_c0_g1_i3.p2 TRINITY_DN7236_c0_g1~~TRINITY_DN7236_c0_g1_i3.p2  ORF type:complete len:226 (-),score=63.09 TRINITY_DN7236_c0_g1_i3:400-1077(-)